MPLWTAAKRRFGRLAREVGAAPEDASYAQDGTPPVSDGLTSTDVFADVAHGALKAHLPEQLWLVHAGTRFIRQRPPDWRGRRADGLTHT